MRNRAENPVIHIVAAAVHAERARRMAASGADKILKAGGGELPPISGARIARVRGWPSWDWLRPVEPLRAMLDTRDDDVVGRATLHIWDAEALRWCLPLANLVGNIIVEYDVDWDARAIGRWTRVVASAGRARFVCPSQGAALALRGSGVGAEQTEVIPAGVDFGRLNRVDRNAVRERLGVDAHEKLIVPAAPLTGTEGGVYAAWAALLVMHIRADVRFSISEDSREARRVRALFIESGHEHMLTDAQGLDDAELMKASDIVTFLPRDPTPLYGVAWAMAAGRPLLAAAIPTATEYLAHDRNALLCRAGEPKDAARRLLQLVERPELGERLGAVARDDAYAAFGNQHQVERYASLYRSISAARTPGTGSSAADRVGLGA